MLFRSRDRILAAAAVLFGARGLHGARTADIAKRARTTERTLFKYFPTKEALYAAALVPAAESNWVDGEMTHTRLLWERSELTFRQWQDKLLRERLAHWRTTTSESRMLLISMLTSPVKELEP